jgi:hypothetical protein
VDGKVTVLFLKEVKTYNERKIEPYRIAENIGFT